MGIFQNLSIDMIFFLVIGAALFVSGAAKLREWRSFKRHGAIFEGVVLRSEHIDKKNDEGRLIQNYYELRVEYKESGHRKQTSLKSIQEYAKGDRIVISRSKKDLDEETYTGEEQPMYITLILMAVGILTASLPVMQQDHGVVGVSMILSVIFLLLGIYYILSYTKDKKRKTVPLTAEVTGLLYWKKGKNGKLMRPSVSYYPILEYERDGMKRHIRSKTNYNSENSCKIGTKRTLYYDVTNSCVTEQHARNYMLICSVIFIGIALTGIINTLYILIV